MDGCWATQDQMCYCSDHRDDVDGDGEENSSVGNWAIQVPEDRKVNLVDALDDSKVNVLDSLDDSKVNWIQVQWIFSESFLI